MILPMAKFKARLIEIPKIEDKEFGEFTLSKKYRVYSIYSEKEFTDFLVADDEGIFRWISITSFRR